MNQETTNQIPEPTTATAIVESATEAHHTAPVPFYQDPSFLVAFSIVLFVVLTWKHIKRGFIQFTDKYAAKVSQQLREAKQLRAEAEALVTQYRAEQKKNAQLADEIVANTKREIATMQDRSQMELKNLLRAREQQALDKISRLEADVIQELREKAAAMAVDVTQQLLQEILDAQRQAALIDQALREMPKQVN